MQYQILLAASLAALAHAQTSSVAASTTVSQVMPAVATAAFNPAGIDSTTAFNWCHAQLNTCPQICGGSYSINKCDQVAFTYDCVCSNGTVPDCTAFIETLPYYICQETFAQCITNNANDAQGQQTCTDNEKCGTRNATAEAARQSSAASSLASSTSAPSSSAPSSTAGSGSGSGSSSASATAASASASATGAAIAVSQQIATGAFAAVLMAAFKLLI